MESKKKKLLKFLVVISTVFMLVISTFITAYADGAILIPNDDGLFQVNGYAEPDVITVGGNLPKYPQGSEQILDGFLAVSFGKHMNTTITDVELGTLNREGNSIRYTEEHQITLRKYAPYYEDIITEEKVKGFFSNKYERFKDTVRIESTLDNDFDTSETVLTPSISMSFDELSLSEEYCRKYNNASYVRIFSSTPILYEATIFGEVSQFNNVTGEMSYLHTTYKIDKLVSTEMSGKFAATFSILGQMVNFKNQVTPSDYFSIRNVRVILTPKEAVDTEAYRVSTIRISAPAFNRETPSIEEVWNNQNEAYNWTDFTDWITTAVGGFLSFEIMPNVSLMGILVSIMGLGFFILFMKMFAGG